MLNYHNYLYSFASELSDNINYIISNNPTLSSEIDGLPTKYQKWLADRFGQSPTTTEIHPVQDCLPTLKKFSERDSSISAKYKSNPEFKTDIDAEFDPSNRGWTNPADINKLSVDNMERILRILDKKKLKVTLDTSTSYESDKVGKVGSWNIWLPSTMQNSINIAGYDPETNKEFTTWCTARISGSNLFYNYVKPNLMLFYVIKDNPSGNNDWLSIGIRKGIIKYSGDGSTTVDRDNNGLTESSLKRILGESTFREVSNIILNKYKSLSGKSPAVDKIEEAAKSLDKLKEMVRSNSEEEKKDIYTEILDNDNYEASEEVVEYLSNHTDKDIRIAASVKINNESFLERLSTNPYPDVRKFVAIRTKNEALLEKLSNDPEPFVRDIVAYQTNNEALLEKLSNDPKPGVRMAVAKKTNNEELLKKLSIDEYSDVRKVVAEKTNNEALLEKLCTDPDKYVRIVAAGKTNNQAILEELSTDPDKYVRMAVAEKTNNEALLEKLSTDMNVYVRQIAEIRLKSIRAEKLLTQANLYYQLTTY